MRQDRFPKEEVDPRLDLEIERSANLIGIEAERALKAFRDNKIDAAAVRMIVSGHLDVILNKITAEKE